MTAVPRVDFYVLKQTGQTELLRFACRLVEKAYDLGNSVFVRVTSPEETARLDQLLWTFQDRSFIPHELAQADGPTHPRVAVLLGRGPAPVSHRDLLINLAATVPEDLEHLGRIAEIIDADADRKRAGRERFRHYRDLGCPLETHNL